MAVGERAGRRAVGEDREAEAPEAPAQRDPRLVAGPAGVLALGGSAGNAALCRTLARGTVAGAVLQRGIVGDVMDWASDRVGDAMDTRPDEACLDAKEDLEDFMSRDYSREDFHPSTGRGLFDAHYAPADGALTITVGVTFGFANGNPADPTWVASVGGPAAAAAYTADKFVWTEDEKTEWKETAIAQIQGHWSDRWTFHTQRACWEALPPVNVAVRIVERPAAGADKSHFVTTVTKWPTEPGLTESVTPPGAGADQSTARFQESGAEGITNPDVSHFRRTTRTRARYGQVRQPTTPAGSSSRSERPRSRPRIGPG